MIDRLKRVLVESFIGAIALGYMLAETVFSLVRVFSSPAAAWSSRNLYRGLVTGLTTSSASPLQTAVSPAIAFVLLLVIWYLLLRWLYFTPVEKEESALNPERPT